MPLACENRWLGLVVVLYMCGCLSVLVCFSFLIDYSDITLNIWFRATVRKLSETAHKMLYLLYMARYFGVCVYVKCSNTYLNGTYIQFLIL